MDVPLLWTLNFLWGVCTCTTEQSYIHAVWSPSIQPFSDAASPALSRGTGAYPTCWCSGKGGVAPSASRQFIPGPQRKTNNHSKFTLAQFRVHSLPRVHVFGRWEEVAVLGENTQTKAPDTGIEATTFLLPHNFLWNEKLSSQMRHGHDIQPHTKFDPVRI